MAAKDLLTLLFKMAATLVDTNIHLQKVQHQNSGTGDCVVSTCDGAFSLVPATPTLLLPVSPVCVPQDCSPWRHN